MKLLYIVFIFINLIVFKLIKCERIESTVTRKNVNILGVDYDYALVDINLNQELYLIDYISCPYYKCPTLINSTLDCSCDYTDPLECPKKLNPSCNKVCPSTNQQGFNSNSNWTVLELDKLYNISINQPTQFRYKPNGLQCNGYSLFVKPIDGYGKTSIGSSLLVINQKSSQQNTFSSSNSTKFQKNYQCTLCPSDNINDEKKIVYTNDTIFITITPITNNFNFTLLLRSIKILENSTTNSTTCNNILKTHNCINIGQQIQISNISSLINYFTLEIIKSGYYYFNLPILNIQSFLYISSDSNNQYPNKYNSTWRLTDEGDNFLLLYLEPISDSKPLVLYLTYDKLSSSNYGVFSVTDNGKNYPYPLSSIQSVQSGYLSLRKSSYLEINDNTNYYSPSFFSDWDKLSFSILYPQINLDPLFPPSEFIFSNYYLNITNETNVNYNGYKSNSYQISFLLKTQTKENILYYQDYNTILNSKLIINSIIFDNNSLPINLIINLNNSNDLISNKCESFEDFSKINSLIDLMKSKLNSLSITEIVQTKSLIFNINSLTLMESFLSCQNQIKSYFKTQDIKEIQQLKNCPYDQSNPLYQLNPCCNNNASYYQCCNPIPFEINSTVNYDFNKNLVKDQCPSEDCTLSVLKDFNTTISHLDECSVSESKLKLIGYNATLIQRQCKENVLLNQPYCSSDSDCSVLGTKCDLFKRKCIPDFVIQDKQYIQCILENLSDGTLFYLLNGTVSYNQNTIDQIYNNHLSVDCIGSQSIIDRSLYSYYSTANKNLCNQNVNCLDSTCILYHDICFDGIVNDLVFQIDNKINSCEINGVCSYKDCKFNSKDSVRNCTSQCPNSSFCGYCTNNQTQCHNIIEISNSSECSNNNGFCLLPNGNYLINVTESECINNYGSCSEGCGKKCSTIVDNLDQLCIVSPTVSTQTQCEKITSAIWDTVNLICYYSPTTGIDETICKNNNYTWLDCISKSVNDGECFGTTSNLFLCVPKSINNCTKEQCSYSGQCSDQYYFSSLSGHNVYPDGLGKCVHKHTYFYQTVSCGLSERDSPLGCYSYSPQFLNKSSCESNQDFKWWTPAKNETECLSYSLGCKVLEPDYLDLNLLPYNFKFNEMNEEECNNCQDSLNQFTNKFEWRSAKWLPGIWVKPQWFNNKSFISSHINQSVFNYQDFYLSINKAVESQKSELYRTESFCRIDRIQNYLNTLVCSCGEEDIDNASSCFDLSIPILGQIKVCSNESDQFVFDYGEIHFNPNSIQQTCQMLLISQISKQIYSSNVPETLASNFVSYNKPDNYAILNSKYKAIIGTILTNGIMITSKDNIDLREIEICFNNNSLNSNDNNDKFTELDFGIQTKSSSFPTPLNLNIYQNSDFKYCGLIANISTIDQPIYFFINRYEDWQNKKQELFDKETKGFLYCLAIIFLLISLFGLYEISFIVYLFIRKVLKHIHPIQILILTITLFITIRAIYFFLLVNGKLQDSQVTDYILVVLPTFLYFTSFTIIISIWYVIVFLFLKNHRGTGISNRFYNVVISINLILYLYFIAIVLVFQYTKDIPNNICGSRIFIPTKLSKSQKGVSLSYIILQSTLSLIIGTAFIYLGRSLYQSIKKVSKNQSNHQSKIFIISTICSIGFILHCVFSFILTVSDVDSIIFSFFGLIITEIIPVISLFYCFNPNSFRKNRNEHQKVREGGIRIKKKFKKNQIIVDKEI